MDPPLSRDYSQRESSPQPPGGFPPVEQHIPLLFSNSSPLNAQSFEDFVPTPGMCTPFILRCVRLNITGKWPYVDCKVAFFKAVPSSPLSQLCYQSSLHTRYSPPFPGGGGITLMKTLLDIRLCSPSFRHFSSVFLTSPHSAWLAMLVIADPGVPTLVN